MKKIIAPFVRIIFIIVKIIVAALFMVERLTFILAMPLIWVLIGKGANDILDISFIEWLVENKITPFLEKIGVDKVI